jgi:hypothetical protein
MDDQPRSVLVAALVEAIDRRTTLQTEWVTHALVRSAWPGGLADRRDRAALEWVRRWGPHATGGPFIDDCSCAQGRCAVCN